MDRSSLKNEIPTEDGVRDESAQLPSTSDDHDSQRFCTADNIKSVLVQVFGGTFNGYSIGFVAVYAFLFSVSTDCSLFGSEDGCNSLPNAECSWDKSTSTCGWKEFTCATAYTGADAYDKCVADKRCNWMYKEKVCKNPVGYPAFEHGLFAGAMILGATIGAFFSGPFTTLVGFRIAFISVGVVGVVCSVMYHLSAYFNQFWVLIASRLLIGPVVALVNVSCPTYVDQNASKKYLKMIGVLFQVFTTFGIMLAALVGLGIGQSIIYTKNAEMIARMEGVCAFSTLFSVAMIIIGFVAGNGKTKFNNNISEKKEDEVELDPNEYSYKQMFGRLMIGVLMAGTLQLTGINAVMSYAPIIMGRLGMEPMVGNFVVMMWNFVTTLVSIPLSRVLTMRQLFLAASLVAALACLLLCGIPVYPNVASTNVKNGVAITGIAVFIAAFEIGVGPCFFVLAQDMFPPSFRPKGASLVILAQYVFMFLINVLYPITTESISGGPSGDQDKGQAVSFIIFGCIGFVCFAIEFFLLKPWEEASPENPPRDGDGGASAGDNEHAPDAAEPDNSNSS